MMPSLNCPVCSRPVDTNAVQSHIAESHSDPEAVHLGRPVVQVIEDYFKDNEGDVVFEDDDEATAVSTLDALGELGVKLSDVKACEVTTETGSTLTPAEAKRVMTAVEIAVNFRIDRNSFIVNFLDWGIRNSFTEELADTGGFVIVSHPTVKHKEVYYKMETLLTEINNYFGASGSGRSFTFRRFGRYIARSIPALIAANPSLNKFSSEGSPMSNRLGVAPANFLAVTSIFEFIKPFRKWSADEKAAWNAHNRSVTKVANTQNDEFLPTDLRPQPSQASTMVERFTNDFAKRHNVIPDYGKGSALFERMWQDASKPKNDTSGVGY